MAANVLATSQFRLRPLATLVTIILLGGFTTDLIQAAEIIAHDPARKHITLSDAQGELTLGLSYGGKCTLDRVAVRGREVIADGGVYTGMSLGEEQFTSRTATEARIVKKRKSITLSGIKFGPAGHEVLETWTFIPKRDHIVWRITREYSSDDTVTDVAFPEWNFQSMFTWTGGLLDHGGVVWSKYLDKTDATYGGHFGAVTFWNARSNDALYIAPRFATNLFGAGRFSRQTNGVLSFTYSLTHAQLEPKHGFSRFLGDRQDLWKRTPIKPSKVTAEFVLQALDYDRAYDRGNFVGVEGNNVRELLNTVARYGVIDSKLVGANGWRSGYICLHEPFFAQIAAAVNNSDYTANLSAFLDNARDHAIAADGRVKSRWTYGPTDAMPGSYDAFGFYEAQWGYLMDSQPDYVMNVVEQFYITGDRAWLAGHKESCERALEFLTRREIGNSGLVAMMNDSHTEGRGSDWIDIIWAAYANAFVNARLYAALNLWADAEESLGDSLKAAGYRNFAARLKDSFNRPTSEGGFWDSTNQWYVYWRDKDGSIHGNNLVTPVNFAAIAYGLCDIPERRAAILDRIETEMSRENLFYWPLNFFPYDPEEGAGSNFPFPKYENGDLFLSWGELGIRAYATYNPALALKYVKNTLARYAEDGLSFQRYLRSSQRGEGDDILAGNCMPIVGLYRNIYGIRPKPNRLYLEPHLVPELNGTRLRYDLRGQRYEVALNTDLISVTANNCTIEGKQPFGVNANRNDFQFFNRAESDWAMSIKAPKNMRVAVRIQDWRTTPEKAMEWSEVATERGAISHTVRGLQPNTAYRLEIGSTASRSLHSDKSGDLHFRQTLHANLPLRLRLAPSAD